MPETAVRTGSLEGERDEPGRSRTAADGSRALRHIARVPVWIWFCAAALLLWLYYPGSTPNFDTYYSLAWAQDILAGRAPDYDAPVAPTPHPLLTIVSMVAVAFGSAGPDALVALAFVLFGLLCYLIFALGRTLFSWQVGIAASVVVFLSAPIESYVIRAYLDVGFAALVVYAVLLEARRLRRGVPVLGVLLVAGLLRPEAWLLAAAYWIYLFPSRDWAGRAGLAALVAAGPALWVLSDLALGGSLFHSLGQSSENAAFNDRPRTLAAVPRSLPLFTGYLIRWPAAIAAFAGVLMALVAGGGAAPGMRRAAILPLAVGVVGGAGFAILGAVGQPLLARYVLIVAAMGAIFAGVGAFGWLALKPGPARSVWAAVGAVVIVGFVAYLPRQAQGLASMRSAQAPRGEAVADLDALVTSEPAERLIAACAPLFAANHRAIPILRYWMDLSPGSIRDAHLAKPSDGGLFLMSTNRTVGAREFGTSLRKDAVEGDLNTPVPSGFTLVASNRSWELYAGPACAA